MLSKSQYPGLEIVEASGHLSFWSAEEPKLICAMARLPVCLMSLDESAYRRCIHGYRQGL
ncbi:MAG: hypothetical protein DSZ23_03235 [Thermodesulfatator sp.]|nr:MAG: hypothetical protein DSZ23_03235 [Thermodesulfatator sp.]